MGEFLGCESVTKTFGAILALDDVTLDVNRGEWLSIVGPNGAGKTTLLNVLNGFYTPDQGSVYFLDDDITQREPHERARAGLARTFQHGELFEEEDVFENIMAVRGLKNQTSVLAALLYYGPALRSEVDNAREVEEIIDYLELWEHRHKTVETLAMGLRRRVGLGRAMALEPDVILLDEIMSGLSFDEKYDMVRLIRDLNEERDITIIMIEHDLEVVGDVSDRLVVMHEGSILADGDPDDVVQIDRVQEVYTGEV